MAIPEQKVSHHFYCIFCPEGERQVEVSASPITMARSIQTHLRSHNLNFSNRYIRSITILYEEQPDEEDWLSGIVEWRQSERGQRPEVHRTQTGETSS